MEQYRRHTDVCVCCCLCLFFAVLCILCMYIFLTYRVPKLFHVAELDAHHIFGNKCILRHSSLIFTSPVIFTIFLFTLDSCLTRVCVWVCVCVTLQHQSLRLSDVHRKAQLWRGIVSISLIEAHDLQPMDTNGLSDPYVKFRMGHQKYKSKVWATSCIRVTCSVENCSFV